MPRSVCPELYPDARPSRFLAPLLPYLPRLLRLAPWLVAAPAVAGFATLLAATLPLMTWMLLAAAVLTPLAAGVALFTVGWE
ncbi:MAG: hypothetical protein U0531_21830 [Dehalococcoidia bacterium]